MKRQQSTTPPAAPGPRLVYCRHAGAPELEAGADNPLGSRYRWEYAISQVDSRRGGYVVEYDAEGRVVRRHPVAREVQG